MKLGAYSSLTAFLAHYDALRAAREAAAAAHPAAAAVDDAPPADTPGDRATLAAMEALVAELGAADRAVLNPAAPAASAAPLAGAARHRARAELNLRRLLAARGLLAG
ncbi:MAG: hypothetical protein IVW56_08915 [Candidatus Binataceae bacterium]|nr:hypothetical protein [Candidatus Binataceae bacterium]